MKTFILTSCIIVAFTGMVGAEKSGVTTVISANTEKKPALSWEKTTHNFGQIPQGKPVSATFYVTNTGKAPLIIAAVRPSCGCTTQDYTKESIAPGKKGFVTLTYNAAAVGAFNKTATVTTNAAEEPVSLIFSGEVMPSTTPAN